MYNEIAEYPISPDMISDGAYDFSANISCNDVFIMITASDDNGFFIDYEIEAKEKWNYGFAGREWRAVEIDDWSCPFHPEHPPVILEGYLAEVDWRLKEDFRGIARNVPENHRRLTEPELRHLIPYGSTVLRMTEMPMLED